MPIYSSRPKGPVTGDLSGSYPNPQVVNLSGSATGSFLGNLIGTASYSLSTAAPYDQSLNTTDSVTFNNISASNIFFNTNQADIIAVYDPIQFSYIPGYYNFIRDPYESNISGTLFENTINGWSTTFISDYAEYNTINGDYNTVSASSIRNNFIDGTYNTSTHDYVQALGKNLTSTNNDQFIVGQYNNTGSNYQFAIANGNSEARSNVVEVSGSNVYIEGSLSVSAGVTGSFSGSAAYLNEVQISDYLQLLPVGAINIPTNQSASYIYTSGSTNDMYFTQYSPPYTNTTRLRWLEGSLNTGLLHGGVVSTTNGTNTFSITSGSGLIVSFNAFTGSDPYPTINFVNFTGSSNIPLQYSSSAQITYISLDTNGHVVQKTSPPTFSDFKTSIVLGRVLHQSGSVTNGAINTPPTAYGVNSNVADFVRAIGPLKINGHFLAASGSTTLALTKTSGDSYVEGRNYSLNPNIPNIVLAANDLPVTVTKIYRQYMSGSTPIINTGVAAAGYPALDPTKYQDVNGTLQTVSVNDFTVQRIFWFPRAVNNALFAYYGQATYTSIGDAVDSITTENFVEGDNTRSSAILVGYVVLKGNAANFTSNTVTRIYQASLFRGGSSGGGASSAGGTTNLSSLTDVQIGSAATGETLVYDQSISKWVDGNPAYATSAGSAATSSYVNPLTQSVYVQGNLSASSGVTGSFSGSSDNLSLFSTTNGTRGVVPGSNNVGNSYFLRADGVWALQPYGQFTLSGSQIYSSTAATITGFSQDLSSSISQSSGLFYFSERGRYLISMTGRLAATTVSADSPEAISINTKWGTDIIDTTYISSETNIVLADRSYIVSRTQLMDVPTLGKQLSFEAQVIGGTSVTGSWENVGGPDGLFGHNLKVVITKV